MALDLGAMQAVERLSSYITRGVYTVSGPFHPFGGAVDIIVVEQQDGGFKSSPWYVRFGKFQGVLKTREKVVNIFVNGTEAGFHMYLDHKGEAYFLKDADSNEEEFSSSPTTSEDETDGDTKNGHFKKTQSCDYESNQTESLSRIDVENGKVVARTNSRPSRIFGLVFGRKSMKEDACVDNMPRLNSLERAEIAADLLETKWSTNLPTNRRGRNSTRTAFKKGGKEAGANEDQSCGSHDEALGSLDEGNADKPSNDIVNAEHIDEVTRQGSPRLRTHEEVIEVYRSEIADIVDRREVLTDIPDTETSEFDAASGDSLSRSTTSGSKFSLLFNEKDQEPDRRDADLTPSDSADQSGDREVSSYIYDKIESSSVRFDAADDHVGEFLILSSDSNEQAKPSVEVAYDKAEHTLEENIGAVNGASTEENSTECKLCHHQHFESDDYVKYPPHDRACREDFESPTAKCNITEPPILNAGQIGMDSLSSPDAQLLSSDSTVEAIKQGKEAECVLQKTNPPSVIGILENQSMEEIKPAWLCSCTTGFEVAQPLISNHDTASQYKYIFPDSNNLGAHDEEVATVTEGVKINEFELSGVVTATEDLGVNFNSDKAADVSIPSLKSIVDDQFLFSKTENCACSEVSSQSIITAKEVHKEENLLLAPEGDVEENEPNDIKVEMSPKALSAAPTAQSSPIWIPAGRTRSEKSGLLAKSLPNFRSHIHDLDSSDTFHPLSHSLRLNSLMQEQGTSKEKLLSSSELEAGSAIKDVQVVPVSETVTPDVDVASLKPEPDTCKGECSGSSQLEAGYASEVILVAPTSETAPVNVDAKGSIKQTGSTVSPTVEMSLCKHLLFEGMGAEAASQAFDAEKVDLERFTVLGPSIVKNNRLTVRIDGQYFPWDSAAHIVLGMISFGQEQLFDLEGMIAVDRAEKTPDSDPSKAIVRTGGAWKLWPFSFKKSRTMTTEHLAPDETKEKDAKIAQEDNLSGANNTSKPKAMKKKVQSLTPSSEQLASLNLKEGRNLVTFNFETAMLGRQQVDARIYLWKWNTRIVISDVDGTITKSDVLGQFMPLVGKDWSQTGVTHLFSSIKENGFQFLFLSARAISQAYLTRQFLFNLKQDGKALPDGPVVISPDGLFPSLYREVIRRAPHEFKISCLEEIRALFPPDCNPFYAGFGNRHTDEISYLKVGIPKGKIFTINPKGEVAVNHRVDTKSYTSLHALVNGMFPATTSAEQEDYNSWNFWRLPLPDIDI